MTSASNQNSLMRQFYSCNVLVTNTYPKTEIKIFDFSSKLSLRNFAFKSKIYLFRKVAFRNVLSVPKDRKSEFLTFHQNWVSNFAFKSKIYLFRKVAFRNVVSVPKDRKSRISTFHQNWVSNFPFKPKMYLFRKVAFRNVLSQNFSLIQICQGFFEKEAVNIIIASLCVSSCLSYAR